METGQPRAADTLLGIQAAIGRVMQLPAGWIGTVHSTVPVESPAVDRAPQKQQDGDAALAIDTVMEVDPSNGYRLCGANSMLKGWSSCSVRERTRCRPRGRSSDCPGLSLFPRRKAFWVATCTSAKHKPRWGRDWAAGRLLSRQPALRHTPRESPASKRALPSPVVLPIFQSPTDRPGSAYFGCCAQGTRTIINLVLCLLASRTKDLPRVPRYLVQLAGV